MSILQKYAIFFWIPLFPIKKSGITVCTHCKNVLEESELNEFLKNQVRIFKKETRTPWWTYIGLMLIGLMILAVVVMKQFTYTKNLEYLASPLVNDVYEMNTGREYSLMKLEKIENNRYTFKVGTYGTNKLTDLKTLHGMGETLYGGRTTEMTKDELQNMLQKGNIMEIHRK